MPRIAIWTCDFLPWLSLKVQVSTLLHSSVWFLIPWSRCRCGKSQRFHVIDDANAWKLKSRPSPNNNCYLQCILSHPFSPFLIQLVNICIPCALHNFIHRNNGIFNNALPLIFSLRVSLGEKALILLFDSSLKVRNNPHYSIWVTVCFDVISFRWWFFLLFFNIN